MSRFLWLGVALLMIACGSIQGPSTCAGALPSDVGGLGSDCGQGGHLAERISTDARTYSPGQTITVTITATDDGPGQCIYPFTCPPVALAIDDSSGKQVWATPFLGRPCPLLARLMQPGETASSNESIDVKLATGLYSVTGQRESAAGFGKAYFAVC